MPINYESCPVPPARQPADGQRGDSRRHLQHPGVRPSGRILLVNSLWRREALRIICTCSSSTSGTGSQKSIIRTIISAWNTAFRGKATMRGRSRKRAGLRPYALVPWRAHANLFRAVYGRRQSRQWCCSICGARVWHSIKSNAAVLQDGCQRLAATICQNIHAHPSLQQYHIWKGAEAGKLF